MKESDLVKTNTRFVSPPILLHPALCGPLALSRSSFPCPFIITPFLPLVSQLTGSRW